LLFSEQFRISAPGHGMLELLKESKGNEEGSESFVSNTLYSLRLTGDFVTQSVSSNYQLLWCPFVLFTAFPHS
jgi:hypothetical protein